jgi:DNA-directed RNA polymerase II subunit RPB1
MITEYENNPEMMERDVFEFKLLQEGGILPDVAKLVMANLKPDNGFNVMISSGSKGKDLNIGQVIGCLGLLAIEGKLAPKKYNGRTLAYFHQNDDRLASRGISRESYMDGLTFPSFTYLLMSGREGIIDGAIKTADTGYAQRRLIKCMEDHMIKYDCTVRTANEGLIQLIYGDSGSDTTKQYDYNIDMAKMSDAELKAKFYFDDNSFKDNNKVFEDIKNMRDTFRYCMIKSKNEFRALSTKVKFPVNFNRVIDTVQNNKDLQKGDIVKPDYVYERLEEILANKYTKLMPMSKAEQTDKNSIKNKDEYIFKTFFKFALYNALAPKRCVIERKLTIKQFDKIINDIVYIYNRSIVQPGEMVGVLSAHSLGETITQMNLNTFHAAGIKTMSSTIHGIPRIKEILGVSKSIKTPNMTVFLNDEYKTSKDMAKKIASNLKNTTIADIRGRINVYYDQNPDPTTGIMKKDNISGAYYTQKTVTNKVACQSEFRSLPWLMRIEIMKDKMLEKEISLLDIKSKFCNWWEKRYIDSKLLKKEEKKVINKITNLSVLSNTDNDSQPVIHIRFNVKDVDKVRDPFNREMLNEFIDQIIDKFKIKGIDSISDIPDIIPEKLMIIDPTTKEIKNEESYVIYTSGTNLIDIRYIIGINVAKTISNDIVDVYKHFGIEIARSRLLRELFDAYERASNAVSYTNLSILIDTMCINGALMSIDRHGMNKSDTDVLGRASFERAVEQILTAGVFGETDHMRGVSSRIMGGLVIKGGTGFCDVIMDTNQIEKSEYISTSNIYRTHTDIRVDDIAKDIINQDAEDMFIPM